jgi:hypothetical protein
LDTKERDRMQQHAEVGAECIREIEQRLGSCNFLTMAREIPHNDQPRRSSTDAVIGTRNRRHPCSGFVAGY